MNNDIEERAAGVCESMAQTHYMAKQDEDDLMGDAVMSAAAAIRGAKEAGDE